VLFHVEPEYQATHKEYRRVLQQRNAALRAAKDSAVDAWTLELARIGQRLASLRGKHVQKMMPFWERYLKEFVGVSVRMVFERGWPSGQRLEECLAIERTNDRQKGFTRFGPHRADLKFRVGRIPARYVLSRGEGKLFVYALKLAQAAYVANRDNRCNPLMLLDDLPSELDDEALGNVMRGITDLDLQSFLTAISPTRLQPWETVATKVFHVERGRLKQ